MVRHRGIGMNRAKKKRVHCPEPHADNTLVSPEQQTEREAHLDAMIERTDEAIKRTRSFLLQDAQEGVTIWKQHEAKAVKQLKKAKKAWLARSESKSEEYEALNLYLGDLPERVHASITLPGCLELRKRKKLGKMTLAETLSAVQSATLLFHMCERRHLMAQIEVRETELENIKLDRRDAKLKKF